MNVYLTSEEHKRVRVAAAELEVSESYLVRLALRDLLCLPLGDDNRTELQIVKTNMSGYGQTSGPVR